MTARTCRRHNVSSWKGTWVRPSLPAAPSVARAAGEAVSQRTYRLAFVTDRTFAAHYGGTNILDAKATLINRVNQVYNDDLAIDLILVDGTDKLNLSGNKATRANGPCGPSPCFASWQLAGCGSATLDRNVFVVGQILGAGSYDIGHLGLGKEGGGIAGIGVVGKSGKAAGCTGLADPEGDVYAIDYLAHEIGHQFAANHTFNGTLVNCSGFNRNPATSVEPGSGSSAMAYAGICGNDDLQPHSDTVLLPAQHRGDHVLRGQGTGPLPRAPGRDVARVQRQR